MKKSKTLELSFERLIPAPPREVFAGWLNPKTPGTPWHENDDLILNAKKNGLFYWLTNGNVHYGRFTELKKSSRIQLTWMSRYTLGEESLVTLTFQKQGDGTLMTLVHSNLPNDEKAKAHEGGWNYFMDKLAGHYGKASRKKKQ
jgi:uncharacterized protein YndB with AHSA1/START domain